MTVRDEINLMRDRIVRLYQPDKIVLFGSRARGEAGEDSDIDVLVISDREKHLPRYKRGLDVRLQLADLKTPKDILFYSREDIDRWESVPQSFVNRVLREGRVLYER
jgi:predicted nucleotidyltransferase